MNKYFFQEIDFNSLLPVEVQFSHLLSSFIKSRSTTKPTIIPTIISYYYEIVRCKNFSGGRCNKTKTWLSQLSSKFSKTFFESQSEIEIHMMIMILHTILK